MAIGATNRGLLHASCVAVQGRGLLILGPSGSGKSGLALQLMALGADLVADDQTELFREGDTLVASCPAALAGLIEARGVGLLRAPALPRAPLALVADLSQDEQNRLPPHRNVTMLGITLSLVLQARNNHFPASLLAYLAGGRQA